MKTLLISKNTLKLDGLIYRVVPIRSERETNLTFGSVNTAVMYDNVMNKFDWGNMNNSKVYLDENNIRMTTNCASIAAVLLPPFYRKVSRAGRKNGLIKP